MSLATVDVIRQRRTASYLIAMGLISHSNLPLIHEKLCDSSPADDLEQNSNNRKHQESMNQTAQCVGSQKSYEPQQNQNDSYSVKHTNIQTFLFWGLAFTAHGHKPHEGPNPHIHFLCKIESNTKTHINFYRTFQGSVSRDHLECTQTFVDYTLHIKPCYRQVPALVIANAYTAIAASSPQFASNGFIGDE
jgi:hypothetical protein